MNDPADGAVLEGRVRDLSHGGDAVVETERGIVLARGALPGERVRLVIERRSAGAQRGRVLALLDARPDRIQPACPIVERCGGCPLMALAPAAQADFKRERLRRVLARQGASVEPDWTSSPQPLAYRARARLHWRRAGGGARIGYRAAASHTIVEPERCAVLGPELERGLAALRARLAPLLQGEGEIALGLGAQARCVALLQSRAPQPEPVYAAAHALCESGELGGLALQVGERRGEGAAACFGDPRQLAVAADGQPLWAPPGAFVQANPEVNAQLVARAVELAAPAGQRVLELYAGHGNFSVALAVQAAELRAVEAEREAAEACRENLDARGLTNARVVCESAERAAQGRTRADVVVLDPPRTGAREVLPALIARRLRRIVYVSCDPTTLGRDLAALAAGGFRVDAASGFDMFPQTAHLEAVVRLIPVRDAG